MFATHHALPHWQGSVGDGHLRHAPRRQADDTGAARWRGHPQVLRVEFTNHRERGAGEFRHHVEPGGIANHQRIEGEGFHVTRRGEPIPCGLLGDHRGRQELRDVVLGLLVDVAGAGELEEAGIAQQAAVFLQELIGHGAGDAGEAAGHTARPAIVGGGGQEMGPELPGEIGQITGGRIGGLVEVAALVHPAVHAHPEHPSSRQHELPHPDGAGPADRGVAEPGLDQGQVDQVSGDAVMLQPLPDVALVARQPLEPDGHPLTGGALEEPEVVLDPLVLGPGGDIKVKADPDIHLLAGRFDLGEQIEDGGIRGGVGGDAPGQVNLGLRDLRRKGCGSGG